MKSAAGGAGKQESQVSAAVRLEVGDQCELTASGPMRKAEDGKSDVAVELPLGVAVEVKELSLKPAANDPVRVLTLGESPAEGWLDSKSRMGEPLLVRHPPNSPNATAVEVGSTYTVKAALTVRAGQAMTTGVLMELSSGATAVVEELGDDKSRRARIASKGVKGWISIVNVQGELLLEKAETQPQTPGGRRGSTQSIATTMKNRVQVMLEASRSGNVEELQSVLEGVSTGGKFTSRPNLNACDIRGKTALIYASAYGHKEVVEYLLTFQRELDVNAVDDTQKSALHYACRRSRSRRHEQFDEIHAGIVGILLLGGSYLEARDHNGCTALLFAAANGDSAVARPLLNAQANVNVKDFEGSMPMDYAKQLQHEDMEALLSSSGAIEDDGDSSDDDKGSPFSSAPKSPRTPQASPRRNSASSAPAAGKKEKDPAKKKKSSKSLKVAEDAGEEDQKENRKEEADEGKKSKKKKSEKDKTGEKKKKTKKTRAAVAMVELTEAGDADRPMVVQAQPKEDEDPELPKKRALEKLQVVMTDATAPKEVEAAIQEAESAGAVEDELKEARERVEALKARAVALSALLQAKEDKDVQALKEAIPKAEEMKLSESEIAAAKAVLAEEEPKKLAREGLQAASKAGDIPALKAAIQEGKRVSLAPRELEQYEELLKGAESKEEAEKSLKEAIDSKNVEKLKFAIKQGTDAGADKALLDQAEAALKVEIPKREARDQLQEAVRVNTKEVLRLAVEKGKEVGLEAQEWKEAEDALHLIEKREQLLADVKQAAEDSSTANMEEIDSIRAAKDNLAGAISKARECGVSEVELKDPEIVRKKLHNKIEDLKGSIRVFCRIRPLSSREKGLGDTEITKQLDPMTLQVGQAKAPQNFQFDSVWTPGTQEEVFEDCRDLVQSAIDGYNVTIFAYGQTGAGKTFTMAGVPGQLGVTPRTITELYDVIERNKATFEFTVMGSMLELYRQELVDLLVKGNPLLAKQKLNVRTDKSNLVYIEHLTQLECRSASELEALMDKGNQARTVAATAMNSESSRSHLVLIIEIHSVNKETGNHMKGKMLIVDLAGSERLKKSQTAAEVQKESIEINKSLTALGDVIEALTKKQKVVPYRNHKLTMLMQDSIGGSAKTLMFVNCSPASSNEDETTMSLKYAQRAKNITNAHAGTKNLAPKSPGGAGTGSPRPNSASPRPSPRGAAS